MSGDRQNAFEEGATPKEKQGRKRIPVIVVGFNPTGLMDFLVKEYYVKRRDIDAGHGSAPHHKTAWETAEELGWQPMGFIQDGDPAYEIIKDRVLIAS